MAENRKHHFVPQFYLRNFGSDRSIGVYSLDRAIHVSKASIRGQCQRRHLYGRDPTREKALSALESAAARAISKMIATGRPPTPGSDEHFHLVRFAVFQWGRTPAAGAELSTVMTKQLRARLPDEMRDQSESFTVVHKSPVGRMLAVVATMEQLLWDLQLKLLVNRTGLEFITSDAPAVLLNQWCQGVRGMGTTGLASRGLQIFLPLSPSHLLLFHDRAVYSVGKERSTSVDVKRAYDVVGLNRLQLVGVEENLYYSGATATAEAIDELPFGLRRTASQRVRVERVVEVGGTSHRIHTYTEPPDIRLDISCIRVRRRARQVPVVERASRYRDAALSADEAVRGRGDVPPPGPSTWRVVDERPPVGRDR